MDRRRDAPAPDGTGSSLSRSPRQRGSSSGHGGAKDRVERGERPCSPPLKGKADALSVSSFPFSGSDYPVTVDPYGFERPEDFDFETYEQLMSEYLVVLTRRAIKWSKLLKGKNKVDKNNKMKRYVRKGVPNEHRTLVWMSASGAQQQLDRNPGYYQSVLGAQHDPKLVDTIRTDLNRTFPENVLFRKSSSTCLQKELYNVLVAFGHHSPSVGYCQGMNFIAGLLLIITRDEEKSFWLMETLLGRILPDYYSPSMLGLKTDQEVLGELVRERVPGVSGVMAEHGVMWSLVVSRWFICLYIDVLPVETVLRIWDCLFYEGSKILFRVALTIIHQHQAAMEEEARSLPDVCQSFKRMTLGPFVEDCHPFMQKIFTEPGSLSMATIAKLRATCRARILAEGS
ncbi:Growth hormone-regulated TBC protein 1-A [Merluccius polli]|uniref:Growth hormone-regulated TBC protein 1 n=1 Tax=Merluccius polli TaxID=89951 RepID=A0AA47MM30_MERPO|nr:Growth hormone-regulated TBC protein 1-A [Merluccius polli]